VSVAAEAEGANAHGRREAGDGSENEEMAAKRHGVVSFDVTEAGTLAVGPCVKRFTFGEFDNPLNGKIRSPTSFTKALDTRAFRTTWRCRFRVADGTNIQRPCLMRRI
jgi:hypothetical protein